MGNAFVLVLGPERYGITVHTAGAVHGVAFPGLELPKPGREPEGEVGKRGE